MATIPQPKSYPLIGNIAELDPKAPVQSLMRLAREHGPLFRIEMFGRGLVIVGNQALTEELCDEARFKKALHRPLQEARYVGGDGLFTAHDEEPNWGKAHRLLMPAFGPLGPAPRRTVAPERLPLRCGDARHPWRSRRANAGGSSRRIRLPRLAAGPVHRRPLHRRTRPPGHLARRPVEDARAPCDRQEAYRSARGP